MKKTLKFIINNDNIGDSYTNIPIEKPSFSALCLDIKDDSIEINLMIFILKHYIFEYILKNKNIIFYYFLQK